MYCPAIDQAWPHGGRTAGAAVRASMHIWHTHAHVDYDVEQRHDPTSLSLCNHTESLIGQFNTLFSAVSDSWVLPLLPSHPTPLCNDIAPPSITVTPRSRNDHNFCFFCFFLLMIRQILMACVLQLLDDDFSNEPPWRANFVVAPYLGKWIS